MRHFLTISMLVFCLAVLLPVAASAEETGTVLFSDDFDSYGPDDDPKEHGWRLFGNNIDVDQGGGVGGGNAAKVTYDHAGTSGYWMRKFINDADTRQVYVRFDYKMDEKPIGGNKFLKIFGLRDQDPETPEDGYANTTFGIYYHNGLFEHVNYGNGSELLNDANAYVRYNGAKTDSQVQLLQYSDYWDGADGEWHTYEAFVRFNSDGQRDGEIIVWNDGEIKVHAVNVKNRHDSNPLKINSVDFANYTNHNEHTWHLWYDNIVIADDYRGLASVEPTGNPVPVASFDYTPAMPIEPDTPITFTDTSSEGDANLVAWQWDFGDGSTSTDQNPVHAYTEEGDYTVTLTVTDADGVSSNAVTRVIRIEHEDPSGSTTWYTDDFELGELAPASDWFTWGPSASTSVVSNFARTGQHSLQFAYTGNGTPTTTTAGQNFAFSSPQDEVWVEYWIYFPDGTEAEDLGPRYVHRYPGVNQNQHRIFELTGPDSNLFAYGVRAATNVSLDGDNKYFTYWTQPDGSSRSGQGTEPIQPALSDAWRGKWTQFRMHYKLSDQPNSSMMRMWVDGELAMDNTNMNVGYPDPGQMPFVQGTLMGTAINGFPEDTNAYIDDFSMYIEDPMWGTEEENEAPTASFTRIPGGSVDTTTELTFTDTSMDNGGQVTAWSWEFGDGATSTEQHPTHTFNAAGMYTVSLVVTDDTGLSSEAYTQDVQVTAPVDPALIVNECAVPQAGWIYCDDFEVVDMSDYYDYYNHFGRFQERTAGFGRGMADSRGLMSWYGHYLTDPISGEYMTWAKLAFGDTPDETAYQPEGDLDEPYRELYWRFYVKNNTGQVDEESGEVVLAEIPTGPLANVYGMGDADTPFMKVELAYPDETGELEAKLYGGAFDPNGEPTGLAAAPLAELRGDKPVMLPAPMGSGPWHRIEMRVKLNDPGQANGAYGLWVDGELELSADDLDWVGSYDDYGINVVELLQDNNDPSWVGESSENRVIDNMILSEQPIGPAGIVPQNNANLSALTQSAGKLTPAFRVEELQYTLTLPHGYSGEVSVTPELADEHAALKVNGLVHADGAPVVFSGANLELEVTAPDGETTKVYTVTKAYAEPHLVNECDNPQSAWLFCDDFEVDRMDQYFERTSQNQFYRDGVSGLSGSSGMKAEFRAADGEQHDTGAIKLALGRTPHAYMDPVAAEGEDLRELYARFYVKNQEGWTGGGGDKLARMSAMQTPAWAQSMIAHVWSGSNSDKLVLAPASGTDAAGNLVSTKWNDFPNLRWLEGGGGSDLPMFSEAYVGEWYAVEMHVKLNDSGQSNGVFEMWIDDELQVSVTNLNWIGDYEIGPDAGYGLNWFALENYWNDGTPVDQERYFDNLVISREKIGLAVAEDDGEEPEKTVINIEGTEAVYVPGDSVALQVNAEYVEAPFTAADVIVNYDPDVLAFATQLDGDAVWLDDSAITLHRDGMAMAHAVKEQEGHIRVLLISAGDSHAVEASGPLFTLHGQVSEDAVVGESDTALIHLEVSASGEMLALDTSEAVHAFVVRAADNAALATRIAQAQALHDAAEEGEEPGQYPAGAKATLLAKITAAESVSNNLNANEQAITAAVNNLEADMIAFEESRIPVVQADRTALQATVNQVQGVLDRAVEGDRIGQYEIGAKEELQSVHTAAQDVLDQVSATQAQVDQATAELQAALAAFESRIVTLVPGATKITIADLSIIADFFGATSSDSNWSEIEKADLFGEGEITIQVLAAVAQMILSDWMLE